MRAGVPYSAVDADVVFLRNPFPELLRLPADIAVATAAAPCGCAAVAWDGGEEGEDDALLEGHAAGGGAADAGRTGEAEEKGEEGDGEAGERRAARRRRAAEGPRTAAEEGEEAAERAVDAGEGVRYATVRRPPCPLQAPLLLLAPHAGGPGGPSLRSWFCGCATPAFAG
jgi:hypothetical protein